MDVMMVEAVDNCGFCFAAKPIENPYTHLADKVICTAVTNDRGFYKIDIHPFDHAKPDWCPRREAPELDKSPLSQYSYVEGHRDGWNHCVDYLTGGNENG